MAFASNDTTGGFKTEARQRFSAGFGLILRLHNELPMTYDHEAFGAPTEKGLPLTGTVVSVLGARSEAPAEGSTVTVRVRPNDLRQSIFDDLLKANEGFQFLLEGINGPKDALEARWAHGSGTNRQVKALEIVGPPHVSFENPVPGDGPKKGSLHLNLDGSPTSFDVRAPDGTYSTHELPYDEVARRLGLALSKNLKFKVSQRVLEPSAAILVGNQSDLEHALTVFRGAGYTSCVVRTFIPDTTDANQVDVQVLSWPIDIPSDETYSGVTYEMPMLQETRRFVALRDGEAIAKMEVIPGYVMTLVGNADTTKSTKHRFAQSVAKGLSDAQKTMYATQAYGPGIAVSAVGDDGAVAGLVRLALRTEGPQYRNLLTVPTPNFTGADKVKTAPSRGTADAA